MKISYTLYMEFEDIKRITGNPEKKNTYMCDRCKNSFANSSTLKRHLNRKTPCKNTDINVDVKFDNDDKFFRGSAKADNPKFDISKLWDPDLEGGFSCLLSASRRSGKTNMIKYLYNPFTEVFDFIIFFSDTIHNVKYDFVEEPCFNKFNPDVLQDLFTFQRETDNQFKILVIMDDCVSEKTKADDSIMQLYLTGRNWNISCIISSQVSTLISKKVRGNTDFVFIGKTNTPENRLNLINTFLVSCVQCPENVTTKVGKEQFLDKYILDNAKDYHFIVLDYQSDGERVYDFIADKVLEDKKTKL
jgi:hypothetical protein